MCMCYVIPLQLMLELAKLYLHTEDLDACQHQCMTLVKNDKENDAATVVLALFQFLSHGQMKPFQMLADLMFRKGEYDQALFHFKQLLERQPG